MRTFGGQGYKSTKLYRPADVVSAHETLEPFTDELILGKRGAKKRICDFVNERREYVEYVMLVSLNSSWLYLKDFPHYGVSALGTWMNGICNTSI